MAGMPGRSGRPPGFKNPGAGRKKGSKNKSTVATRAAEKLAEASVDLSGVMTDAQIMAMTPLDVMLYAMRLEMKANLWRPAAGLAEKVAPYLHARLAAKTDGLSDEERAFVVKIIGGLPE